MLTGVGAKVGAKVVGARVGAEVTETNSALFCVVAVVKVWVWVWVWGGVNVRKRNENSLAKKKRVKSVLVHQDWGRFCFKRGWKEL